MAAVKDSSPDNLGEGRRLLEEMKELRKEIKKIGDISSIKLPKPLEINKSGK